MPGYNPKEQFEVIITSLITRKGIFMNPPGIAPRSNDHAAKALLVAHYASMAVYVAMVAYFIPRRMTGFCGNCNVMRVRDYYSVSPTLDPTGPTSGTLRVYRGGGWDNQCGRASERIGEFPDYKYYDIGFRCASN